jgi:hypothetical protein
MTVEMWDPEQALIDPAEDAEGCDAASRYGVTGWEMRGSVPLAVALAEELPDVADEPVSDDQWLFVDPDEDAVSGGSLHCAEELAMHVVTV